MTDQGPFAHWQNTLQPRADQPKPPGEQPGLLPPIFQFSQNSLQDYADCARRFQLRYVLGQRWPAAESEPIDEHEQLMEQGTEFHRLVQRHLLGIPAEKLAPVAQPLAEWWDAYLHAPPPDLPQTVCLPEAQLTIPFGAYRLLAKFDLLAIEPGQRAVIVDWKTTRSRPTRNVLARRLQSRVYPYVLVEAGAHLFDGPLDPAQVNLVYWFAGAPGQPEVFHYNAEQHADNRAFLTALVDEIRAPHEDIWPLTNDDFHCRYCVYRSLCNRGVRAGALDEGGLETLDADFDFEIDIADVDEIAF